MKTKIWVWAVCLSAVIWTAGCAKQKAPPPPRTQPELLLEIYDSARRQQYEAALIKIQKMRALDPTSVFLADVENVIKFNRLTAVVNAYLRMGKFEEALNALLDYEKKYGYSEATEKAKERLFLFARLDHQIRLIKESTRRADELENRINVLKDLLKKTGKSPKIVNFIQKKESMIPELRKQERILMLRELHLTSIDRLLIGDRRTAYVLSAIFAMQEPDLAERQFGLLAGYDKDIKIRK
ncbi:MAG: hypothetical protein IJS14_10645 [Lentisphaeria bacterium]|nr:hypothetical protein [Lentisphaeria bacterium]